MEDLLVPQHARLTSSYIALFDLLTCRATTLFLLIKTQNDGCNVIYKYEIVDILTQNLLTLLIFIASLILRKVSICREWFLFGMSYYVIFECAPLGPIMDNNMVSKIWVGMSTIIIFKSIQNSRSLARKGTCMPVYQNSKFPTITFAILHFLHKISLTILP